MAGRTVWPDSARGQHLVTKTAESPIQSQLLRLNNPGVFSGRGAELRFIHSGCVLVRSSVWVADAHTRWAAHLGKSLYLNTCFVRSAHIRVLGHW